MSQTTPSARTRTDEGPMEIEGEFSIGNADELHRVFAEAVGRGRDLVVDLSGVQTCDTAVLQLICSLRKTAQERGLSFGIASVSSAIETTAAALGVPIAELTGGGVAAGDAGSGGTGREL